MGRGLGKGQRIKMMVVKEVAELIRKNSTKMKYVSDVVAENVENVENVEDDDPEKKHLVQAVAWLITNSMRSGMLQYLQLQMQMITNLWRKSAFRTLMKSRSARQQDKYATAMLTTRFHPKIVTEEELKENLNNIPDMLKDDILDNGQINELSLDYELLEQWYMTFLGGIQQRLGNPRAPMQIADMIAQMLPPRRLRDMQRSGLDHTKMKKLIHENFVVAIRNLGGQGKQIAQSFDQCIERADKKVKYTIDQREQSTSNKLKKQKELDLKKEREKIDRKKDKDELKKLNNGITKQSISLKADTNFVRLQSDSEEEEDEEDEAFMLAMALSMSTKKDNAATTTTATVPVPVQRQTTNDILLNTARDTLSANNSAKNDNLVATAVEQKEEKKQSHSRQNTASFLKTLATSAEQKEEEDNNKEKENKEKKEQEKENKEKKEQDEKKEKEEKKKVMINDTSEAWLSRCVSLFREPLDMDILNTVPTSTTSFIDTLENIVTELNNANVLHLIEENEEEEKKEKKNNGETTTATATETTTATTASTTTSTKKFIQSTENQIASSILFEMRSNEETIQKESKESKESEHKRRRRRRSF